MKKNLLKVKCLCCGKTIAKYNLDTGRLDDPRNRVTYSIVVTMPVTGNLTLARTLCTHCNTKCNRFNLVKNDTSYEDMRFTIDRLKTRIKCLSQCIKEIPDDKKRVKELKRALARISYEMKMHIILSQV